MSRIEPGRPRSAAAPAGAAGPSKAGAAAPASRPEAAAKSKDRYVEGSAGQPRGQSSDPLSDLSEIRQRRSARADSVKKAPPKELSRDEMLRKAREAIVSSFEKDFVPTFEFQDLFGQSWAEVKDRIEADARKFGADPNFEEAAEPDGGITFIGHIYELYTEVTVRKDGTVERPYFEID
jgi:hypothetical protein